MLATPRPASHAPSQLGITRAEWQVLLDVSVGLTDDAMAQRHQLSRRGVQNRLASVYRKLRVHRNAHRGSQRFAPRSRMVFKALALGLLTRTQIMEHEVAIQEAAQASAAF